MVLSIQQARELLKSPANKVSISEAQGHEERIKLHTKAVDKKSKASTYFKTFLEWVERDIKLPADKFTAFEGMCQFPLPTTTLCGSIFDEFKKIFTAQDAYRDFSLLDDTMKSEFTQYVEDLGVHQYFVDNGLSDLSKSLNCIYVVDLPSMQATARPQPYFYKVPIASVIDVMVTKTINNSYKIGYLIYQRGNIYTVIDAYSYKLFEKGPAVGEIVETYGNNDYRFLSEAPHYLGEVPACFLSTTTLYDIEDGNSVARKNPLSDHAGDLDWLLFFKTAGKVYETYGPFPIITVPATHCTFTDKEGNTCSNGYVSYRTQRDGLDCYRCPNCSKNSLVGPGTVMERDIPKFTTDVKLDPAAVVITPPDIPSLDYITNKVEALEWNIFENAVGSTDQVITKAAVNEPQVQSSVEGKRNVLLDVKKNFEHAERFITDIMGRLMYGEYYVGCTINYGEQFLLYTARDIVDQITAFNGAGLPTYMKAQKRQLLVQTENKNNPYEKSRSEIMELLEPWPDLAPAQLVAYQYNTIFPEKFGLKIDFAKFISKFELSNGDIVEWGSLLSLEQKINKITEILTSYVTDEFKKGNFAAIQPAGNGSNFKK